VTWTKLSDDWSDDVWTLSDGAVRLHGDGLVWSNRKLLDLVIPKEDLARFSKRPDCVQELLDGGWWTDEGIAYRINHHADYQRTREQVIKQQGAARLNGKRGGRPGKPSGIPNSDTQSQSEQVSGGDAGQDSAESDKSELPNMETQSVSHSLTQSATQRDGTGQAAVRGSELKLVPTGKPQTKMGADETGFLAASCPECQRKSAFGTGPCPLHKQGATA
jgi:hypothetical protein